MYPRQTTQSLRELIFINLQKDQEYLRWLSILSIPWNFLLRLRDPLTIKAIILVF